MPDGGPGYYIEEITRKLTLVSGYAEKIVEQRKSVAAYEILQLVADMMKEDLYRLRKEIEGNQRKGNE